MQQRDMLGHVIQKIHCALEPVYNSHPQDFRNWPFCTGSLKILTRHG